MPDERVRSTEIPMSRGPEELGRVEGVGEAEGDRVMRLEQRGAVAFTCMAVAVVVILLITLWGHLF